MDDRVSTRMRSPLGRVTGLGSAKDGTAHWWAQRLSAVALVPLAGWMVIAALAQPNLHYATVHAWLARPFDAFLAALCVAVLAYHSWLGTTVIVEDYVHGRAAKFATLIALRFAHALVGAAGVFAILRLSMGTLGS
jgi:succinate dehydrogenase / fumarate reductase membrane anchor subunit